MESCLTCKKDLIGFEHLNLDSKTLTSNDVGILSALLPKKNNNTSKILGLYFLARVETRGN